MVYIIDKMVLIVILSILLNSTLTKTPQSLPKMTQYVLEMTQNMTFQPLIFTRYFFKPR